MEDVAQAQIMYIAATVGGIAFALSGFLVGARKNLDIMGIFILSFLAANGGGLIRDLLVDRSPVILLDNEPFLLTAGVVLVAGVCRLHRFAALEKSWLFVVCDAVGLVAFGITGALVAVDVKSHFFGFMTLSFLTATGGGILRDMLAGNVPEVMHSGFYGSVAILLGAAIFALHAGGLLNPFTLLCVFACALSLRLVAYRYGWKLPKPTDSL